EVATGFNGPPYPQVPGYFYANARLEELTFEELRQQSGGKAGGGFLPAVKQIANVAALPGIVKVRCMGCLSP
ncbi:unnamed protein product, partial [Hapterophycus canaliculatus]